MGKGLDLILERIRQNPAPTLIGRYMALVQDIKDVKEKAERVLALAEAIALPRPDDALKLAHDVYQVDPKQLRAIEIMASAFAAKGRHGKAAVLRIEKEKLERASGSAEAKTQLVAEADQPPSREFRLQSLEENDRPPAAPIPIGESESFEKSPLPALDLFSREGGGTLPTFPQSGREAAQEKPLGLPSGSSDARPPGSVRVNAQMNLQGENPPVQPSDLDVRTAVREVPLPTLRELPIGVKPQPPQGATKTPPEGISPRLLKKLVGHAPGDTILPSTSGAIPMTAPPGRLMQDEDIPATVFSLFENSSDHQVSIRDNTVLRSPKEWVEAPKGGKVKSKERARDRDGNSEKPRDKDRLRDKGKSSKQGESRGDSSRRPEFLVGRKMQFAPEFSETALSPPPSAQIPPSWEILTMEIMRLQKTFPLRSKESIEGERLQALALTPVTAEPLPEELINGLLDLENRVKGLSKEHVLGLKWNLFQGMWGSRPSATCAFLIKGMGLRYASLGFWGLYLDSLIADCQLRIALHEVRQTLIRNPHLDWARLAMNRLPLIWEGLKVYGISWHEDQGVQALINALSERPRPKLSALLEVPPTPKRAGR